MNAKISIYGDIMFKLSQIDKAYTDESYVINDSLYTINEFLNKSDFNIGNLETPITDKTFSKTNEKYSFSTPIEFAYAVKKMGFDLVTTANNHCLDRGVSGLVNTIDNLDSIPLEHIGTYKEKTKSYIIKEINGIKVGILSFTYGTNAFANNNYLKKSEQYMVDLLQNQEQSNFITKILTSSSLLPIRVLRKMFRKLKWCQLHLPIYERESYSREKINHFSNSIKACKDDGAEYIIVCLHIGGQYNEQPTAYTKRICELAKDCGANAVIANHEHIVQKIDLNSMSEKHFCIYSLGNFLSSSGVIDEPFDKMSQYSVAVHLILEKENKEIKANYKITICDSVSNQDGIVYVETLYTTIVKSNEVMRGKLMSDYKKIMNKVFDTQDVDYPLVEEYDINI